MTVSWHSISISQPPSVVAIFSGYFCVNNATNLVTEFYQTINGNTDNISILISPGQMYTQYSVPAAYNDNVYLQSHPFFTNGGVSINVQNLILLGNNITSISLHYTVVPSDSRIELITFGHNSGYFGANGHIYTISDISNTIPVSTICFPAGTPITTNQGTIPIEKITPDIHTIRNKQIVGITQTITQDKYLVCFEKDSLGINLPSQKTTISKNHCIFYNGKMVKAKDFIDKFENVKKIKYTGEVLYNVLLKEHDKMMVNNLICETLNPENSSAKFYKCLQNLNPEEQKNLIENYNEYVIKNNVFSSKKLIK